LPATAAPRNRGRHGTGAAQESGGRQSAHGTDRRSRHDEDSLRSKPPLRDGDAFFALREDRQGALLAAKCPPAGPEPPAGPSSLRRVRQEGPAASATDSARISALLVRLTVSFTSRQIE